MIMVTVVEDNTVVAVETETMIETVAVETMTMVEVATMAKGWPVS